MLFGRPGPGSTIEDDFETEADVVDALGLQTFPINVDLVLDGEAELAARAVTEDAGSLLYRGPILSAEEYESLYDALADRGAPLLVTPTEMEHALYVPEHHDNIADLAPPTAWTQSDDPADAWEAALELGPGPFVLKDHVKSAKEDWEGACFVPEGADRAEFIQVCRGLREARGDRFERGFVVRRFLELTPSGVRTQARRIPDEHRLFFWNGRLVAHAPYLPVGDPLPDTRPYEVLGERIDSPFFTADIAFPQSGGWVVIEINDGGMSGLPEDLHPRDLFEALR